MAVLYVALSPSQTAQSCSSAPRHTGYPTPEYSDIRAFPFSTITDSVTHTRICTSLWSCLYFRLTRVHTSPCHIVVVHVSSLKDVVIDGLNISQVVVWYVFLHSVVFIRRCDMSNWEIGKEDYSIRVVIRLCIKGGIHTSSTVYARLF